MKQEIPIFPTLFNIRSEGISRKMILNNKNLIINEIQVIAYADDLTMITNSTTRLVKTMEKLHSEANILN